MMGHFDRHHSRFLQLQTSARLLVQGWSSESIYGLIGTMLAAVAASITYECLNEYLVHLKRKAFLRRVGSDRCGSSLLTFGEKLGQTIIQILRVILSYFMMLCVMTMNVWLLVAVVVGAFVGYGVGKPLLANRIEDALTSHGHDTVTVQIYRRGNDLSERSKPWRYHQIVKTNQSLKTRQNDNDNIFLEGEESDSNNEYVKHENIAHVVWIRRSKEDLRSSHSELSEVFDDSDSQFKCRADSLNGKSIRSEGRHSSRSCNRFRSTSKIINDSFRSSNSEHEIGNADTRLSISCDSRAMYNSYRKHKDLGFKSNKVNRTYSSATSKRFKPVSLEIMRQMSFNEY